MLSNIIIIIGVINIVVCMKVIMDCVNKNNGRVTKDAIDIWNTYVNETRIITNNYPVVKTATTLVSIVMVVLTIINAKEGV